MRKLFHKFYIKHKKGFTLFEVLVVLVIMAVLAGIAVPTYNKIIRKSRVSDGLHVLDMLAGAQDKYFVDHGVYAQSLTSLNAPFKEYRVQNPNSPFSDIITTNFTYDKVYTQHCIRAKSNIGGNYTLVKNYKTKDKVVCKGPDCADVSDFVEEISDEGYSILCPNEIECNLTQEQCGEEHFFEDTCSCACKEIDYQNCMAVGGIFVQSTCKCVHFSSICAHEGQILGGYYTGESCNYQGPIPEYGNKPQSLNLIDKAEKKQQDRGIDPGNGGGLTPAPDYVCGMEYTQKICRNHVWTMETDCVYKGDYCREQGKILDPKTCDCITSCDPDNKPMCVAGNYTTCDPCPNDPDVPSIIEEILQGNSGPHCFHCGHIPSGSGEPTCDTQTGQWLCPGAENGTCTEVSASFDPYQDCNGKDLPDANPSIESSNTCGQKTLSNVKCWQEIIGGVPSLDPIYSNTCELKDGNACFTGDTRECTLEDGSQGVEHCIECKWDNNCVPAEPSGPCECKEEELALLDLSVPGYTCAQYSPMCVTDENDPTSCHWEVNTNNMGWIQEDYECETGWVAPCSDPTESCDMSGGGRGGSGGGTRVADGSYCCDQGELMNCGTQGCYGCYGFPGGPANSHCDSNNCNACLFACGGAHHLQCDTGSGVTGGGGYFPPGIIPPPSPGNPPEPTITGIPTKICQNCKWSCCSHCNFADKPADYTSQCAFYRTKCSWMDGGEGAWISGHEYYNSLLNGHINNNDPNVEWFGNNECENAQSRSCNNFQGKQFCNGCHWGECNLASYSIIQNAPGVRFSTGESYYCPNGVKENIITDDPNSEYCQNHPGEYIEVCSPGESYTCNGTGQRLNNCTGNTETQYRQFCLQHGSGARCIISGNNEQCYSASCHEDCCPPSCNGSAPFTGGSSQDIGCSRTFTILQCN